MIPKKARRLASRLLDGHVRRAVLAVCVLTGPFATLSQANSQSTHLSDVLQAQFGAPTARYGHAVLGESAEWGSLTLDIDRCPACAIIDPATLTITLPETRVFEDLVPRVIDLDHDGINEVVVIESDAAKGARLSVYDAQGFVTATPFIGRPYRWLAPLGAADLDGDGTIELAYIDRPHLAKTLRVWRYQGRSLQEIASLSGLTNHKIGQAFISGGIRECDGQLEIITADADWQRIIATQLNGGALVARDIGTFEGTSSLQSALTCP